MLNQIFTTKVKTSQEFVNFKRTPVTILSVPKQTVINIRTEGKDKYEALQIAIYIKNLKPNKPQLKTLKAAGLEKLPRYTKEIRLTTPSDLSTGTVLSFADVLSEGDTVKATGTSKGKGFAGVMKRHGFHGGPRTHGQSDRARAPGSIGRGTTPGRVVKGKKMAGRMGGDTVSVSGLKILHLDEGSNLVTLKGLIPGAINGLVRLTLTKKNPNPVIKEVSVEESIEDATPESENL